MTRDSVLQITSRLTKLYEGTEIEVSHLTNIAIARMEKLENKLAKKAPLSVLNRLPRENFAHNEGVENISSFQGLTQVPAFDSLTKMLTILKEMKFDVGTGATSTKIAESVEKLERVKVMMIKAEKVKTAMYRIVKLLTANIKSRGAAKQIQKMGKNVFYYSQRLQNIRGYLNDKEALAQEAVRFLTNSPQLRSEFNRLSRLSTAFGFPAMVGDSDASEVSGLQTKSEVASELQKASGKVMSPGQIGSEFKSMQLNLNVLKQKVLKSGGAGSDDVLPVGFKPNNQKTKSFLRRLEVGFNFQSERSNGLLSSSNDVGLSAGYKMDDRSIFGVGAAYKVGITKKQRGLNISHEGLSLRSFVEYQLKGSFWVAGGYEMAYRSAFKSISELDDYDAWQRSGLIGLSKVISLRSKLLKKAKVQLMWDFLSYKQIPVSQPIVVRFGYTF